MASDLDLFDILTRADLWLDSAAGPDYQAQPLAQDWARVAKVNEEAGEAIDALIGMTCQNPRKGVYADRDALLGELADCAVTSFLAMQHFTKNIDDTMNAFADSIRKLASRIPAEV